MNTQTFRLLHRPMLVGSIVAILLGGIAIASLAIPAQGFNGVVAPAKVPAAAAVPASAAPVGPYSCTDCGVIESTREIEGPDEQTGVGASGRMAAATRGGIEVKPLRNYEITVRMHDGSMRVIRDPKSAKWRQGEPVIIIAGADQ
jgi:hypothetical protein